MLAPYRGAIAGLVLLTIAGNALNLLIPRLVAAAIDGYGRDASVPPGIAPTLLLAALGIFVFAYLQSVVQTYASERVARDLRTRLVGRIAAQDHAYIQQVTPAALLTNLTSDVDAVKMFVVAGGRLAHLVGVPDHRRQRAAARHRLETGAGRAGGAADHRRHLRARPAAGSGSCSSEAQEAIDWLNKVINESILGAALIRLVNSQQVEYDKFVAANTEARDISLSILRLFAGLIPVIMFATNLATLMILTLGGRFVINGSMTLGDFTAFNSYLVDPDLPGHHDRLHEQRDGAGERVVRADLRVLERPGRACPPARSRRRCAATSPSVTST